MPLTASSLAAATGVGLKNTIFAPSASTLPRKIVIIGTYDNTTKTTIVDDQLYLVTSPEDVGDRFGFGFQLHRLAMSAYTGSQGVETWVVPQVAADPSLATGTITIVTGTVEAGTLHLRIAGDYVPVAVATSDDETDIATKIVASITADTNLPVTATNLAGVVTLTSKDPGEWANEISITLNFNLGEETPVGITSVTIVDMAGGSGKSIVNNSLDALGVGDDQNERYFTELIHGFGQDANDLDDISEWNGIGNDFVGNYNKIVARPLRSLVGNVEAGSTGLSNLITFADARLQDRTNGVIAIPGSPNHPSEIAAQALGIMARINSDRAAEHYVGKVLQGVLPGAIDDRWTSYYDSRDTAVKSGISPTVVSGGSVLMQDMMTFYRPVSVPVSSNSYALQRNIAILENIAESVKTNFASERWAGIFIVQDVTKVTSTIDRQKARDITAVLNDVVTLAKQWESRGWIFTADYTIGELQKGGYIEIRPGGTGFNIVIPVILSGAGRIYNIEVLHDTSLAILTVA